MCTSLVPYPVSSSSDSIAVGCRRPRASSAGLRTSGRNNRWRKNGEGARGRIRGVVERRENQRVAHSGVAQIANATRRVSRVPYKRGKGWRSCERERERDWGGKVGRGGRSGTGVRESARGERGVGISPRGSVTNSIRRGSRGGWRVRETNRESEREMVQGSLENVWHPEPWWFY